MEFHVTSSRESRFAFLSFLGVVPDPLTCPQKRGIKIYRKRKKNRNMARPGGNPDLGRLGEPYRFTSENQPERNGNKPSLLKKYITENNLSSVDVSIIAKELLNKSRAELMQLVEDKTEPILVVGCAAALLKDMTRGLTSTLQWLADRGVGKTVIPVEYSGTMDLTLLTKEERNAEIERLYQEHQNQLSGSGPFTAGQINSVSGQPETSDQTES